MNARPLLVLLLIGAVGLVVWLLWGTQPSSSEWNDTEEGAAPYAEADLVEVAGAGGADARPEKTYPTLRLRDSRPLEDAADAGSMLRRPITLRGRVLQSSFHPAAGVKVTGYGAEGRVAHAVTNAKGEYALPWRSIIRGTTAMIVARAADGQVARGSVWMWSSVVGGWTVKPLVLQDAATLRIHVLDGTASVSDATVRVLANLKGQEHNDIAVIATSRTTVRGRAAFPDLPPGSYVIEALAEGGRRAVAGLRAEAESAPTHELHIGPRRPVTVRVRHAETRAPLEGVAVAAHQSVSAKDPFRSPFQFGSPRDLPRTDARGRATILRTEGAVWIRFGARHRGYEPAEQTLMRVAIQDDVELLLKPLATARWRVVAGERPVPADGAAVTLWPLQPSDRYRDGGRPARMEGDLLVVDGVYPDGQAFIAQAADDSIALVTTNVAAEEPTEVSFAKPRSVTAIVRGPSKEPVPGMLLTLRSHGVYPYSFTTNGEGRAVFPGLPPAAFEITSVNDQLPGYAADTTNGPAVVQITLGPARTVHLSVTVDGKAQIPPGFELDHGQLLSRLVPDAKRGMVTLRTHQKPHAHEGETAGEHAPSDLADIRVSAPGLKPGGIRVERQVGSIWYARVDFRSP